MCAADGALALNLPVGLAERSRLVIFNIGIGLTSLSLTVLTYRSKKSDLEYLRATGLSPHGEAQK